ncbi:hypothetical protein F4808DRAFT_421791 [Astrocystis sublimbata]|nr:hypothetical protein F4808DRAFT_421791 [Astrocystis sublimbata]
MTNLGPAPTNFELPSSCAEDLQSAYWYHANASTGWWLIQGPEEQTTCYPSGYATSTLGEQYYSPGQCPTGFTAACQGYRPLGGTLTETIVTCCPTQAAYSCQTRPTDKYFWESTLGCVSTVESSTVLTFNSVSDGATFLEQTTTLVSSNGFNAYSIQVRYQATDLVATAASTGTTSPQSTSSTTTSSSYATSPHDMGIIDVNGARPTDAISPGAAAGIAIGAFAGLLVILAAAWYLMWHKPRRNRAPPGPIESRRKMEEIPTSDHSGNYLSGSHTFGYGKPSAGELCDAHPAASELNGQPPIGELGEK